jgi:esterase/lipase superfamily enzyme
MNSNTNPAQKGATMPEVKIKYKPEDADILEQVIKLSDVMIWYTRTAFDEDLEDTDVVVEATPHRPISRNRLSIEIEIIATATPARIEKKKEIVGRIIAFLKENEKWKRLFKQKQISVWLQLTEGCFSQG